MSRSYEIEIEIHASPSAVWRALADAEELSRWFVEAARVTPGVGGSIWLSWGDGMGTETRIEVWEPERRLRVVNEPRPDGDPSVSALERVWRLRVEQPLYEEWRLEPRGDVTVLRLVESDIPDSPDWDGFYEGTRNGWRTALLGLRHYLERHHGQPRHSTTIKLTTPLPMAEAKAVVTSSEGLGVRGEAGERYRAVTGAGEVLEGTILEMTDHGLLATVETLDDALLSLSFVDNGQERVVWVGLSTYGPDRAALDAAEQRWTALLGTALNARSLKT
jgi:uncharacterized protein YndB with AHSA1/START domain